VRDLDAGVARRDGRGALGAAAVKLWLNWSMAFVLLARPLGSFFVLM
jgi:hypothetical protein